MRTADVSVIEVRSADGALLQRIEGLQTSMISNGDARGLQLVDLDFDGYADLRLMQAPGAGPNTNYLNWLFDSRTRKFVASPTLDDLPSVKIFAAERELRSEWRDGPALYGTDVFVFRDGKLVPTRRERRTYSGPGVFKLVVSRFEGGKWKIVEKRAGRD